MFRHAISLAAFLAAAPLLAAPVTLTPADPQPAEADLSPGLAVSYGYPGEVRTLADARDGLKKARRGPPLRGLSYEDNAEGDLTLTSRKSQKVAAEISGFLRFDAPGTYTVNIFSNDGIEASLGGAQIALYDDIHACEPAGEQEIIVPEAGWYALEAVYFQRKGTACLAMDWDVTGRMGPVPDASFSHIE